MNNALRHTHQWELFTHTREAWDRMLDDCTRARVSIDMEQYIFEHDSVGTSFADALMQKAQEGVRVRLLCDAAGSFNFLNSALAQRLTAAGVAILFFNPIKPWRINNYSSWFFRDHRKLLVIDSAVGYIGGVGIHQRMERWRDTQVRVEGHVVCELERIFHELWEQAQSGKPFFLRTRHTQERVCNKHPQEHRFSVITNSPRFHRRFIYHHLIEAIRGARTSIYLTTPYFIPDFRLVRVLRLAAHRGVDIRLIVPDVSDHPIVDIATQSYFWIMLKAGVRIYLYHDHVLHAKTIVIDDHWASVGSANLDNLSLLFNYEANVVSTDRRFAQQLHKQFNDDLRQSHEVSLAEWKRRPWIRKALEIATWPVHKFL